ncbi:eukaryotic translation initiation factor 4E-1B-like [Engraulis encrasicolus]|uniref:eukaryotic translation initiation factor 4E-1B-like n=1 Tax=Engraulis encrasicolus TaxID=184585 RepID=UPI002FD6EACD
MAAAAVEMPRDNVATKKKTAATNKQKTVLVKQPLAKHTLQTSWGLWFFKNDKRRTWQENLQLITNFHTVEDFWALYNSMQLPSKLSSGCDYSVFRRGIKPMWEDRSNNAGGRWLVTVSKQKRHTDLDKFWQDTLLCLIGEGFGDYSTDVCGAVVNVRAKGDKIAVWTANAEKAPAVKEIGHIFKDQLGLSDNLAIGYQAHADTATKSNSNTRNKFVV